MFLSCKVFEVVKVGCGTLLAELSFRHAFHIVRAVRVADILVHWLVYVRMYCVLFTTLNQNKRTRLIYLGDAQIRNHFGAAHVNRN